MYDANYINFALNERVARQARVVAKQSEEIEQLNTQVKSLQAALKPKFQHQDTNNPYNHNHIRELRLRFYWVHLLDPLSPSNPRTCS